MTALLQKYGKSPTSWLVVAIIILAGALIIVLWRSPVNAPTIGDNGTPTNAPPIAGSPEAAPAPGSGPAAGSGANQPAPKPAPAPIGSAKLLTPAAGDVWAIDKLHSVAWVKPSGYYTATAILVDAATKKDVGWIAANITAHQTGFSWDTQSISTTRSGGIKQVIFPGTYYIRVVSDGKDAQMVSGNFSLVPAGSAEALTPIFRFKDYTITPTEITVAKGAKVIFINNDTTKHTLTADKFGPYVIPAGSSYTLDTGTLAPGNYFYTSNVYTYRARGTLIVK